MKLLLLNPCQETSLHTPPMGLLSIATYLKEYSGNDKTKIFDMDLDFKKKEYKELLKNKPDIVGMTSTTSTYKFSIDLAEKIKKDLGIPIIIGGVHISTLTDSFSDIFDVGILGEGEETILELMNLFEKHSDLPKKELRKVKGVVFKDGKLIKTGPREPIIPLDKIPMLDRSFLDKKKYFRKYPQWDGDIGIGTTMITSRGCPYRCVFCSTAHYWGKPRLHSASRVFEEIKSLNEKYGVDHIHFWDDLFIMSKSRVKDISELLVKEGLNKKVAFNCQLRSNLVNDDICKYLKAMNVNSVGFGFESGSERMLNYLKAKSVTLEQHKNAIKMCRKYGFRVDGSLMFGSPGETVEDIEKTLEFIQFMKEQGVDRGWCLVTTPYPGTPIWEIAMERGKISDYTDIYDNLLYEPENALLLDDSVDKEKFVELFKRANMEFESFKTVREGRKSNIKTMLKNDPLGTMYFVLRNPRRSFRFVKRMLKVEDYTD